MATTTQPPLRLASIDVFRAVTMFLMIFVNDLWTLKNIPIWLEHTAAEADGMGLADTVFPAFLFIVGLSIPFAHWARRSKRYSLQYDKVHIFTRSLALITMGFFHVNLENYSETALLPKPLWQVLITIAFFLIWLDYPLKMNRIRKYVLQGTGVLLLLFMAMLYSGKSGEAIVWMRPQWWGILGLIGWSYLLGASAMALFGDRLSIHIGLLLFLLLFNIGAHAGWLDFLRPTQQYFWIVGDGSMPALTMAGLVTAIIYRQMVRKGKRIKGILILAAIAVIMLLAGFAIRPVAGISKIRATPSWVIICTAISIACFLLFIYIADIRKKDGWFKIIKPAGTSTLTCYLLPYIHYAVYTLIGISLPLFLRTGIAGIIKSLLYSLVIILLAGLLEKWRLRLKI